MYPESCLPLAAVMEQSPSRHTRWRQPQWTLVGFVAGKQVAGSCPQRLLVHSDAGRQQWLWTGLQLCLYRDRAESYWYNLTGRRPALFLVCREGGDGELVPYCASADYDEAGAHMEADDQVFSAPPPPEVLVRLERFVMQHYEPRPSRRRRRTDWKESPDHGWKPSPRLARP